jgi:hypothetical protein
LTGPPKGVTSNHGCGDPRRRVSTGRAAGRWRPPMAKLVEPGPWLFVALILVALLVAAFWLG